MANSGNVNGQGQAKLAATGTAQPLPPAYSATGFILTAKSTNASPIVVGDPNVTNVVDGTGTGFVLEAGNSTVTSKPNLSDLSIIGSSGDVISFSAC